MFIFLILILFVFQPFTSLADVQKNPEIVITDEQGNELMHYMNYHRITPVDLERFDEDNLSYLLHIEDRSFMTHSGFNLQRIFKTLTSNLFHNQRHGASTITQQYIKNLYLNNSKSISRKIKELYYAIKLEQVATKEQILEGYLNCIYLGNDIYGFANASRYYFNTSYDRLTAQQMIALIALLNAPSYYSSHITAWEKRKNELAKILHDDHLLDTTVYQQVVQPLDFDHCAKLYPDALLYYCDAVLNEFKQIAVKAKFNQKIIIQTRYHSAINDQKFTTNANIASITIDQDGFILSCIGDIDYARSTFNIALNGKRDIGSTIKPLLYYEALKCGYSPSTTHYSAPFSFQYHDETISVSNYGSIYPYQKINMKNALATSDNIYAIKTHLDLGMKTLVYHLRKYNTAAQALPSLALGSIGMSLYQLIRIYSQFFTEGLYLEPKFIETVSLDDQAVFKAHPQKKQLLKSDYVKQIKELMNGMFDSKIKHATGLGIASLLKEKCYGKSGLTDYDSYMIGFSNDILIAVWSGHLDNRELKDSATKKLPKQIFLQQMNAYIKNKNDV